MMEDPLSYKTIFVLDCSTSFRITPCGKTYEIDVLNKSRQTSGITPLSPISKSLYTCAVEAIFEYCRIVWDLFPNGERMLRVFCCLTDSVKAINNWDLPQQNYESLLDSFQKFSIASKLKSVNYNDNKNPHISLLQGFVQALGSLTSVPSSDSFCDISNLTNSARIIFITNFDNETAINSFKEEVKKIFQNNNLLLAQRHEIINKLDLVLINTVPIVEGSKCVNTAFAEYLADNLHFTIYSIWSGSYLAAKLTYLSFDHYDLASTTVSGIPMKEEQSANSSANYDVEIVHSKKAHSQFFNFTDPCTEFDSLLSKANREEQDYKTLVLKWCTPKSNSVEINSCTGAYRVTAVDVNSRPSSCLINFLHTGKTVNLEMQRIKNNKIMSHMLQSHNGELFIHVLSTMRSPIEDPPSISEGVGGRIIDYRINDFADLMRKHRLVKLNDSGTNLEQARNSLKKATLYYPLSTGFTVFFLTREHLHLYYQLITKDKLTDQQVLELKNIIYTVASNESKGLSLNQSNMVRRFKKEEAYRILWNEMEHITRCYNETPQHQSILQCLLDCKPKSDPAHSQMITNMNVSSSLKNVNTSNDNIIGRQFGKINLNNIIRSSESLQSLNISKLDQRNSKRKREFIGRTNSEGKVAKLYAELVIEEK